jgi:hypothetical protein
MSDSYFKILAPNVVGLSLSMAEVESSLRICSLLLGISLSVIAFVNNERRKKKNSDKNSDK